MRRGGGRGRSRDRTRSSPVGLISSERSRAPLTALVTWLRLQIGDAAQQTIEQLRIGSTSTFLEVLHGQEGRRLLGHRGCDELIDGNVILLGDHGQFAMQRIRQSQTVPARMKRHDLISDLFIDIYRSDRGGDWARTPPIPSITYRKSDALNPLNSLKTAGAHTYDTHEPTRVEHRINPGKLTWRANGSLSLFRRIRPRGILASRGARVGPADGARDPLDTSGERPRHRCEGERGGDTGLGQPDEDCRVYSLWL